MSRTRPSTSPGRREDRYSDREAASGDALSGLQVCNNIVTLSCAQYLACGVGSTYRWVLPYMCWGHFF